MRCMESGIACTKARLGKDIYSSVFFYTPKAVRARILLEGNGRFSRIRNTDASLLLAALPFKVKVDVMPSEAGTSFFTEFNIRNGTKPQVMEECKQAFYSLAYLTGAVY